MLREQSRVRYTLPPVSVFMKDHRPKFINNMIINNTCRKRSSHIRLHLQFQMSSLSLQTHFLEFIISITTIYNNALNLFECFCWCNILEMWHVNQLMFVNQGYVILLCLLFKLVIEHQWCFSPNSSPPF